MARDSGKRTVEKVEKPWGYELIWARSDRYVGKILRINAGQALSYQYHRQKEETIYVLEGKLTLHYASGDESPTVVRLEPGEVFHIAPGLRHRFEAEQEVTLLETSTTELDDVVRLEDRYGRGGG